MMTSRPVIMTSPFVTMTIRFARLTGRPVTMTSPFVTMTTRPARLTGDLATLDPGRRRP